MTNLYGRNHLFQANRKNKSENRKNNIIKVLFEL